MGKILDCLESQDANGVAQAMQNLVASAPLNRSLFQIMEAIKIVVADINQKDVQK
jgi:hypothetical protein